MAARKHRTAKKTAKKSHRKTSRNVEKITGKKALSVRNILKAAKSKINIADDLIFEGAHQPGLQRAKNTIVRAESELKKAIKAI